MELIRKFFSKPITRAQYLLGKFFGNLFVLVCCQAVFPLTQLVLQAIRGHTPIDLLAYFRVYGLILLPSTVFVTAVVVLANIVLRNKHLAYIFSIGTAAGLFYLYSNGYNHWLYNPVLYGLWTYSDFARAGNTILIHRIYCLAVAAGCIALAHLVFQRKSNT